MSFEQLHPAVQYHIVNSLGWRELRSTQLEAIGPITEGHNCLLLAPTAGGKTEAAIFPALSRMIAQDWRGISVLYLCPIKALLNNLEQRLAKYLGLLGRRVSVWHGDISASIKARVLQDPPDLLLTTPESLEGLLISRKVEQGPLLGGVRAIIVDELHAFARDDRGWHVRALLGRIRALAPEPVQIIGLTATVGNPQALIDWLTMDSGARVIGAAASSHDADVLVDYVGSTTNAALVLSRLHQGEKRLVFCDSRSRVEDLARELRARGTRTFVSHSSLSTEERRHSEQAFVEARDCVIIATSTLELGIDVGDLDRVIQIDAPGSVSSFLQRMGRTGRRAGARRNCLFLATSESALLNAVAIVMLWKNGYVEDVRPPAAPWHVVLQQMLALLLEHGALPRTELIDKSRSLFPELAAEEVELLVQWLFERSILWSDAGVVWLGPVGEKEFGRRNFMSLTSVFVTPPQFQMLHGQSELGFVSPVALLSNDQEPVSISLAGRAWRVTAVDWKGKRAWVEPSESAHSTRWEGAVRGMEFDLAQAVLHVLTSDAEMIGLSRRAAEALRELRSKSDFLCATGETVLCVQQDRYRWWTFAGATANRTLMDALRHVGVAVKSADDFALTLPLHSERQSLLMAIQQLRIADALTGDLEEAVSSIKFAQWLPERLQRSVVAARMKDPEHASVVGREPVLIHST